MMIAGQQGGSASFGDGSLFGQGMYVFGAEWPNILEGHEGRVTAIVTLPFSPSLAYVRMGLVPRVGG